MSNRIEPCEECGAPATQYDFDLYSCFCDEHMKQVGFSIPIDQLYTDLGGEG